jgi:hypothetical protein
MALEDNGFSADDGVRVTHQMFKGPALDFYLANVKGCIDRKSPIPAFTPAVWMISAHFFVRRGPSTRAFDFEDAARIDNN